MSVTEDLEAEFKVVDRFIAPLPPKAFNQALRRIREARKMTRRTRGGGSRGSRGPRDPDTIARGETHPNAKLTDVQVDEIRQRRSGGETLDQLAAAFGVNRCTIFRIEHRQSRKEPAP